MELVNVYINGSLSTLASQNLISFKIVDNIALELDSLELKINNVNNSIKAPSTNATIELAIKHEDSYLKMGLFNAEFINVQSNLITIKATSQDNKSKIKQSRTFKNIALKDVLQTLAKDLGLSLQLDPSLQSKQVGYLLQDNKTALQSLDELSEYYGTIASVKNNNLIFYSKNNLKTLEIAEEDILSIKKQDKLENKQYNGVLYKAWNTDKAKQETISLGTAPYLVLNNKVDETFKNDYIKGMYNKVQEKQELSLKIQGNPKLQAGFLFSISNTKHEDFKGTYRIEKVEHSYNSSYITNIIASKVS